MTPISIESVPCPLPSVRIVIPEASVSMPATVTPPTTAPSSDASSAPPQALAIDPLNSEEEEDEEEEETRAPSHRPGDKEKIGRWSEHEHLVFLEGLRLYGKQWKTIAGMIGTRTVVQVRTHAQKYFQKVDRSSLHEAATIARPIKRKSLTLAPPSRKARKLAPRRSMPTIPTTTTTAELALDLPSFPSTISKSSSSSGSDGENWSTISPNTVVQLVEMPSSNVGDDDAMDEWDPLEWLIETDGTQNYLPESSLPLFPFSDDKLIASDDPEESSAEMREMDLVQDAILNNMVDPNVTMQSLFLPEEEADDDQ